MSQGTATAPSAAVTTPRSAARRPWPRWIAYVGWTVLGLALAAAVVTFATVQFGAVHGVELNPYTFARRSYSLYEIPILRWQVRGIRREDIPSTVVDFLEQQKYVAAAKGSPDVWHIVTGSRGVQAPTIGDANILVTYLETLDAENEHPWVEWSEKNPKLAPILWKAVGRLAQEVLYVFVPDFFDLALAASDPVAFQRQLDQQLAAHLLEIGLRLQGEEDHAAAKKYLSEAAQLDPANPLIKRALEKSAAQ